MVVPRLGSYLNMLVPMTFFALALVLAGTRAALPATAGFLFIVGSGVPDYIAATYSPWLLPLTFAQALCYAALYSIHALHSSRTPLRQHAIAGLLLGLTFLGHTAPALLIGTVLVLTMWLRTRSELTIGRASGLVGTTILCALVVSAPLLYFIGGKYLFRVVNWYPNTSPYGRLDPNELLGLVRDLLSVPVVMGAAGGIATAWRRRKQAAGRIMIVWLLCCLGFIAYHWLTILAGKAGIRLHSIVPSFHFLFYLYAWLAVGFGGAVAFAGRWMAGRIRTASLTRRPLIHLEPVLVRCITAIFVAAYWPAYTAGGRKVREEALRLRSLVAVDAWEWIQHNTLPSHVFLSTDHMSLFVVNPAGRKVVATDRYFSSPYVDWDVRDRDRTAMFEFLEAHDRPGFEAVALRYGVQFVIWSDDTSVLSRGSLGMRVRPGVSGNDIAAAGLEKVFQGKGVAIFRTGISVSPAQGP